MFPAELTVVTLKLTCTAPVVAANALSLLMLKVTDTWLAATPTRLAMLSVTAATAAASVTKAAGSETASSITPVIVLTA